MQLGGEGRDAVQFGGEGRDAELCVIPAVTQFCRTRFINNVSD